MAKLSLGYEFYVDYSHILPGHPTCGVPHGHTARVIVEVDGKVRGGDSYKDNMLIDFADLKRDCRSVLDRLDHRDLNQMFKFPSVENIASWVFQELCKTMDVKRVRFYEGRGKWCTIEK